MSAALERFEVLEQIDSLQQAYVQALDSANMEDWLNCFSQQQASYVCISDENEKRGLPIALMLDDCRERIKDRVSFVTNSARTGPAASHLPGGARNSPSDGAGTAESTR